VSTEPTDPVPPSSPWAGFARSWALSLSWGWLALLVAAGLAVALDALDLRDALDLPSQAGAARPAAPSR
jgi:hypothetical protein